MPGVIRTCSLVALLSLGQASAGCMLFTTKKEGESLRREVRTLSKTVSTLRQREKDTLAKLRKAYGELKELKEILPKARQILLRSSAQFGVRLDRISSDVAKLKGSVDDLLSDRATAGRRQREVADRLKTLGETTQRIQTELERLIAEVRKKAGDPKTPAGWWARATVARLTGRLSEAERAYQALIKHHPTDPRVPAAYYYIAKMHFDAYHFRRAIVAVAKLLRAKPGSRFDAPARLLSARSYFELKQCRRAARILARLVRLHPHAEQTPRARILLKRVLRLRNVSRYCSR